MKTLLIDNGSTLTPKLASLSPGKEDIVRYDAIPDKLDEYSLIILSGSSEFSVLGNEEKLSREIELIKNANIPIVGICLGHELIARAFDATLELLSESCFGMTNVDVVKQHPMFGGRANFSVYEKHQYGVTAVQEPLEVLAVTEQFIAVMKHKTKSIYGFQFHPEHHTDEQYGDEVFLTLFDYLMQR